MSGAGEQRADLLVVGAGSGGVRAARLAAASGARVLVVEAGPLGGTCVNLGCIPKKLFYYASQFSHGFADSRHYGWQQAAAGRFDWTELLTAKNREIARLNEVYRQLLQGAGARVLHGRARLLGQGRVEVDGQHYSAEHILLATGSRAVLPQFPGHEMLLTSDDVFHLKQLPQRILVLGGGYIALEFAGIFAGLGRQTALVHRRSALLRGFDAEVRSHVTEQVALNGVQLHLNAKVDRLERQGSGYRLHLKDGQSLEADLVLAATGRRARTQDLGLEQAGVELDDRGYIAVDDGWRTSAPGIWALGDVVGTPQLTPMAIAQAANFHRQVFLGEPETLDMSTVPTAVFSHPSVGTVGLTEGEAVRQFGRTEVYGSVFRTLKDSLPGAEQKMLVKLVVDPATDRVLGAHAVGEQAGEIIQGMALGVRHGLTKAQFDDTLAVHPTSAEEFVTLKEARPGRAEQGD